MLKLYGTMAIHILLIYLYLIRIYLFTRNKNKNICFPLSSALVRAREHLYYLPSYRPITVLSHLTKVFDRKLLQRIVSCDEIRTEQFGFCSGHSTTTQLAREPHYLAVQYNLGRICLGVFLDMEEPLSKVWHEVLL